MSHIEYIVRPFQSQAPGGGILIPAKPVGIRARATLTWGAKCTPPQPNAGANIECCTENSAEHDRDVDKVRINSSRGDGGYVDVERPNKMHLKKKDKSACAGDWDQFSGVGAEVTDALSEFEGAMQIGTVAGPEDEGRTCKQIWTFKNQAQGSGASA